MGKRACYGEIFVRTNLESSSEESIEIKLTITNGNVRTLNFTEFLTHTFVVSARKHLFSGTDYQYGGDYFCQTCVQL